MKALFTLITTLILAITISYAINIQHLKPAAPLEKPDDIFKNQDSFLGRSGEFRAIASTFYSVR